MAARTQTYYHFTSIERWPTVRDAGYLDLTESNMSKNHPHAGPDVVWLTNKPEISAEGCGLDTALFDKTRVRITVEVPIRSVERWRDWAMSRGIDSLWFRALTTGRVANSWYVSEKQIPSSAWVEVRDTKTGDLLLFDSDYLTP
jgi:hypothetical protein